eukprot:13702937-Alexandrium_andersonii.AAC.1
MNAPGPAHAYPRTCASAAPTHVCKCKEQDTACCSCGRRAWPHTLQVANNSTRNDILGRCQLRRVGL